MKKLWFDCVQNFYSISELRLQVKFVSVKSISTPKIYISTQNYPLAKFGTKHPLEFRTLRFFIIYYSQLEHDIHYPSIEDISSYYRSTFKLHTVVCEIISQTALLEFLLLELSRETCLKKTWQKKKNGKERGKKRRRGDIIPRAEVGKSTGCRRLSRLYRCLIGMGGRYEAGWRGCCSSPPLIALPRGGEARVLSIFSLSLSLTLEARSPPRAHLVAPAGVPGDTARWRRSTRHWLKAWKSGHPRRAVRPSQGHCPSVLLVSIAGLIKFMDDKTVDGVGSRS